MWPEWEMWSSWLDWASTTTGYRWQRHYSSKRLYTTTAAVNEAIMSGGSHVDSVLQDSVHRDTVRVDLKTFPVSKHKSSQIFFTFLTHCYGGGDNVNNGPWNSWFNFGNVADSRVALTSDLPKIRGQGALIIKQPTKLRNPAFLLPMQTLYCRSKSHWSDNPDTDPSAFPVVSCLVSCLKQLAAWSSSLSQKWLK